MTLVNGIDEPSGESQATQLLENILRRDVTTGPSRDDPGASRRTEDETLIHDSHSSDASTRNTVPQYHFHGLAATQTDSQGEAQPEGADSQKENSLASWDRDRLLVTPGSPTSPSAACAPMTTSTNNTNAAARPAVPPVVSRGPFNNPNLSTKPLKVVSFRSPIASQQAAPQPNAACTHTPLFTSERQRSPSPASQSSFPSIHSYQDPDKAIVESTKAFHIPLTELGEPSLKTHDVRLPLGPPPYPYTPFQPLSAGRVFVASTPSNSQSSNSRGEHSQPDHDYGLGPPVHGSQQDGDTQVSDDFPQGQGQPRGLELDGSHPAGQGQGDPTPSSPRSVSTELSSSYERLLNLDPFEDNPDTSAATQPATQPVTRHAMQQTTQLVTQPVTQQATQLATQPATQPNEIEDRQLASPPTDVHDAESRPTDLDRLPGMSQVEFPSVPPGAPSTSTTVTVPKNVAGLLGPKKLWRMQALFPGARISTEQTGMSSEERASTFAGPRESMRDMPPSNASAVQGSLTTPITPTPIPSHHNVVTSRTRYSDDMEVVPDSEATDVEMARQNSSPPVPLARLPAPVPEARSRGHVVQRMTSQTEENSDEEVIQDSALYDEDEASGDEDDQDEVPLAAVVPTPVVQQQKGKGKAPAGRLTRVAGVKIAKKATEPFEADMEEIGRYSGFEDPPSRETRIIPSSDPLTDYGPVAANALAGSWECKSAVQPEEDATKGCRKSVTPVVQKGRRTPATRTVEDLDTEMPDCGEEDTTEPADDDYMDVDEEDAAPAPLRRGRKRGRAASVRKKLPPRAAAKAAKALADTPRPTKKLKASSSGVKEDFSAATRVFALWKQDGHYYAGTVYSISTTSPPRYLIHFDDRTESVVDLSKMRLCKFNIGDHVLLGDNQRGTIAVWTGCSADDEVTVKVDNGDDFETSVVELQEVRIASRTLVTEWKDRMLTTESVVTALRPSLKVSPSPSKLTVVSAGSVRISRKPLAKTGFVVTLSAGNDNWEAVKDGVMASIRNLGGVVIEDWTTIFTMEGSHSQNNKCWILRKEDVRWIKSDTVERVLLLSDDANQKPKFLMALALGVPCISVGWLKNLAHQTDHDWQPYLLPAGYSDSLEARVSQMVDLDWGNSIEYLEDIMRNPVASKLFEDLSILCVHSEFVPLHPRAAKRNATDAARAKEASRMVPRILLCMGASYVEAVPDVLYASSKDLKVYNYVVVKDAGDAANLLTTAGDVNCVHLPWVKDCLIAGRLLRRPEY